VIKYVDFLRTHLVVGNYFEEFIEKYKWPSKGVGFYFDKTYDMFDNYRNDFKTIIANKDEKAAGEKCLEILKWGGVSQKNSTRIGQLVVDKRLIETLEKALAVIESKSIDTDKIDFHVNSGFSKIYTAISGRFIIYDSRVAAQMCYMIKQCFKGKNPLEFGKTAYRAKTKRDPGKEFPMVSSNPKQYFISNIKASWIIEELAIKNPVENYSTEKLIFAIQTALFVLGKEIPSDV
jgi:hypothetical protein